MAKRTLVFIFQKQKAKSPTEIEPFGGASLVLGGQSAILCLEELLFQNYARLTGAETFLEPISETLQEITTKNHFQKQAANVLRFEIKLVSLTHVSEQNL